MYSDETSSSSPPNTPTSCLSDTSLDSSSLPQNRSPSNVLTHYVNARTSFNYIGLKMDQFSENPAHPSNPSSKSIHCINNNYIPADASNSKPRKSSHIPSPLGRIGSFWAKLEENSKHQKALDQNYEMAKRRRLECYTFPKWRSSDALSASLVASRKTQEIIPADSSIPEHRRKMLAETERLAEIDKAPDVSWNGPFKAHIQYSYDRWMANDAEKQVTTGGNLKAPSMNAYLQWITDAWDSLPTETIAKSFKDCGITNCYNGSEDDQIHCFKPHGPIPEGLFELAVGRFSILQVARAEEEDTEQDEENGYISDESLDLDWNDELNAPNPETYFPSRKTSCREANDEREIDPNESNLVLYLQFCCPLFKALF